MSVSETIPRIAPTLGGIDPRDLAAEQPAVDRLRALAGDVSKIEYDYSKDGETTITVSGKEPVKAKLTSAKKEVCQPVLSDAEKTCIATFDSLFKAGQAISRDLNAAVRAIIIKREKQACRS